MVTPEEKDKKEVGEIKKNTFEKIEDKEISPEEFLDYVDVENQEFIKQTENELRNLNSVGLEESRFNEIKKEEQIEEKLSGLNQEADLIVKSAKVDLESKQNEKDGSFDRNKFLENFKVKLEQANSKDEVFNLLREINKEQKSRKDLRLLFANFKFKNGEGKEEIIDDYFGDREKELEKNLNDPEDIKEIENISLEDLKKEFSSGLEDFVVPTLQIEESPEYLKMLEKIQNKLEVKNFQVDDFINFLNQYNKLSKNREKTFDEFIFKEFPKKKDDLYHTSAYLKDLTEDPSVLGKIDFLNTNDLNEKLNLFDSNDYYEREYNSESWVGTENIGPWEIIEGEKGVNIFNVSNTQELRISSLKGLSLKSLKLAEKNDYLKIVSDGFSASSAINLINEEILKDIASFDPNIKELSIWQLSDYATNLENLTPDIKDFCKKVYQDLRLDGSFASITDRSFLELVKDNENFNKIKKCYENGLLKDLYNVEKATILDDKQIDLIIKTEESIDTDTDLLEKISSLIDIDVISYKEIKNRFNYLSKDDKFEIIQYLKGIKEIPEENLHFFNLWQGFKGKYYGGGVKGLSGPLAEILYNEEDFIKLAQFYKSDPEGETIIFNFIGKNNPDISYILKNTEIFKNNSKKYFLDNPKGIFSDYNNIKNFLDKRGEALNQEDLNSIFNYTLQKQPQLLFEKNDFPISPEQQKVIDIFTKINSSPSAEMKNMALELSLQIVQGGDLSTIDERYEKIDNIFVKNNIPFVGKQAKICEALHPKINTSKKSSPELQSLHSDNAKRLLIFKDLLRSSFNSLNSNLEQYLLLFKSGQDVLDKYEKGEQLNSDEEEKLKYFFKKVNALSENTRKSDKFNKFDLENLSLSDNLEALKSNFGVGENQTITEKFETTFLKRIGIDNFSEALKYYDNLREATSERNKQLAISGQIDLGENDLAKGVSINYFDNNLDRGIYAPEFVGAESLEAKSKSKGGDSTPWDTDLIKVGNRNSTEIIEKSTSSSYGDAILIIKDRGQFNKNETGQPLGTDSNKLELFKTGVLGEDHYGIRTGFGSTEIDALLVKDTILQNSKQLDSLKFSIAQKGFYIPICDKSGKVIFPANDFEQYKKIFDGVDKYHGEKINLNEDWKNSKFSNEIKEFSQTNENLEKINKIKDDIYSDIENDLKTFGIELHKGRYDDSVAGAKIIDTGSTGRGAALDTGYDFDFVIKIDDRDADKINQMAENLKKKYPYDQDYESSGMRTFRFKSFEKDGNLIDLDISFVKKSDSEELDANEAVAQKYDSIKKSFGEDKLLDVLTNVRFAKKELKKAGCYKKGLTGNGEQQGGLGGIGVENWILKNGGDVVIAFKEFNKNAYQDGELISFNDFKNKYKIFSAGSNIRGGVRAENFVYNMDEVGYQKMAELSKKFVES